MRRILVTGGAGFVGANLARLELQIALEEWHKRIPDYQIADDEALQQHVQGVAGFDRLPLRWEVTS